MIDMAYVQRKVPFVGTPDTNPETKPFFDGCAAGKLVLPRCVDTGKFIWYPRAISPFTFGEAWHKNHHAFPTSAIHGLKRWQFDPSGYLILALERMGLVVRRSDPRLQRPRVRLRFRAHSLRQPESRSVRMRRTQSPQALTATCGSPSTRATG